MEYDEEQHGAEALDGPYFPDGYTTADALDDAIARMEDRGGVVRKVVHPGDPRAGPVADEPRVDLQQ